MFLNKKYFIAKINTYNEVTGALENLTSHSQLASVDTRAEGIATLSCACLSTSRRQSTLQVNLQISPYYSVNFFLTPELTLLY
jgi:S-methylmethionine-dependent homocysteine/selenocysteine methylase